MTVIRMETQKDHRETENVVREAFWNVYARDAASIICCIRCGSVLPIFQN